MKSLKGIVTATNMEKTITVEVTRRAMHPKYKKIVRHSKKYLVHDEASTAKVGDKVRITETRPISKKKRFRLKEVISNTE